MPIGVVDGRLVRGAGNDASYVFEMVPSELAMTEREYERVLVYLDSEDSNRSSWNRYLNHCEKASDGCNVKVFADASRQLVWMATKRHVAEGEELCFDYLERHTRVNEEMLELFVSFQGSQHAPTPIS